MVEAWTSTRSGRTSIGSSGSIGHMKTTAQIKIDRRKIAGDIVAIGATVASVIAVLIAVGPQIHLPASAIAALVTISSIVGTIVAEARRVRDAKVLAAKAAAEAAKKAPAKKAAAKKAPAKKAPGRVAGK